MEHLRVGTLNLWHDPFERDERLERAAQLVADEHIDVLCVQEIVAHDGSDTASVLAERAGLVRATPARLPDGVGSVDGEPVALAVLVSPAISVTDSVVLRYRDHRSDRPTALARIETAAGPLWVASVHLAWGSLGEPSRLGQLRQVVSFFDEQLGTSAFEEQAVIAGDFNTTCDADSVRYLRGLTAIEPATTWTDAHEHRADRDDAGYTQDLANPYVHHTARTYRPGRDGVSDTSLLPERRIDYIFSRGWRRGRPFTPTATRVLREPLISDHYPVVTDLTLPGVD